MTKETKTVVLVFLLSLSLLLIFINYLNSNKEIGATKIEFNDVSGAETEISHAFEYSRKATSNGVNHFLKKDYNKALVFLQNAYEVTPEVSLIALWKGKTHFELNQYKEAQICFEKILEECNTIGLVADETLQKECEETNTYLEILRKKKHIE